MKNVQIGDNNQMVNGISRELKTSATEKDYAVFIEGKQVGEPFSFLEIEKEMRIMEKYSGASEIRVLSTGKVLLARKQIVSEFE